MKKVIIIINPTSGGEAALDYKESLESKAKSTLTMLRLRLLKEPKMRLILPKMPLKKNMMQ